MPALSGSLQCALRPDLGLKPRVENMQRIMPLLENPLALSPALFQFGLAGLLAAAAGLAWCQVVRFVAAATPSSRRKLVLAGR